MKKNRGCVALAVVVSLLSSVAFADSKYDTCMKMARQRREACLKKAVRKAQIDACWSKYEKDKAWCKKHAE